MEFALNYKLLDNSSNLKAEGEAKATLDEEYLTVTGTFGDPMLLSYSDIVDVKDQDYKIDLFLTSTERLNLWGLGYHYEDFLFQLYSLRNELMLKYLLMEEKLYQSGFQARYSFNSIEQIAQNGFCEVRFYENAILILPQKSEPIRIPYCYITNISKGDYLLSITNEFGEKLEINQMGQNFDPVIRTLSDSMNKMNLRSQQSIKELIPEANPNVINKIAALMKDGRAAKRKEIENLSSDFWHRLNKKIDEVGLTAEFEFLNSLSLKNEVCVGMKRGLMGDLTGTYTWFLFPYLDVAKEKFGNTIALEAFNNQENKENSAKSQEDTEESLQIPKDKPASTGATYFFNVRNIDSKIVNQNSEIALDQFLSLINRSMIDINFRREPIYLTGNQLESSEYKNYRFAIAKIPSLRFLRSLFVGRVSHGSAEQWKTDVTNLLARNS